MSFMRHTDQLLTGDALAVTALRKVLDMANKQAKAERRMKFAIGGTPEKITRTMQIVRVDTEKRQITAEVYAPNVLDTYREFMHEEDVSLFLHRFLQLDLSQAIDTDHDNVPNGSVVLEAYIAKSYDPEFTPGSMVLTLFVADDEVWNRIKTGDLNSYSLEALVIPRDELVAVATLRDHVGRTKIERYVDHDHIFHVQVDEAGLIVRGITSKAPDGHYHAIKHGSFTERAGADDHNHRFDLFQ